MVSRIGKKIFKGKETWVLKEKLEAPPARTQRTEVYGKKWNAVELSMKGAGLVKVSVRDAGTPLGVFLRKGETPPAWKPDPNDDRPLPSFGGTNRPGFPHVQNAFYAANVTKNL